MSAISKYLRRTFDGFGTEYVSYYCQGCKEAHSITVYRPEGRSGPVWLWDRDPVKPTFSPSILVRRGGSIDPTFIKEEGDPPMVCHTFISEGQVQFLPDCDHEFAGTTQPLLPYRLFGDQTSDGDEAV